MSLLTIREAATRTGHSTHKIRRLIKAIADEPGHADRLLIEPAAADAKRLTAEGVQFTWRIAEELVGRHLGDAVSAGTDSSVKRVGESIGDSSLLERIIAAQEKSTAELVEQLKIKDVQIAALNDRLRESNVLMASLQQQLPAPKKTAVGVVDSPPAKGKSPEKGTVPAANPKRRGWLGNLFS